jgi:hypothetical protein
LARSILQFQWVALFVTAALAPLVTWLLLPRAVWPWSLVIAATLVVAVPVSVHAWRRRADALALAPITASCVLGVWISYGLIATVDNHRRGHRELAQVIRRLVPDDVHELFFFNEIDEGLWYYLRGMNLTPVPGSLPRYNTAFEVAQTYGSKRIPKEALDRVNDNRQSHDRRVFLQWLNRKESPLRYVLVRAEVYDRLASDMVGRITPLFRETNLKRNEIVLLQAAARPSLSAAVTDPTRR